MGIFPVTSAILRAAYPDVDLNHPPVRVSYKPDIFFVPTEFKMPLPSAKGGKVGHKVASQMSHSVFAHIYKYMAGVNYRDYVTIGPPTRILEGRI